MLVLLCALQRRLECATLLCLRQKDIIEDRFHKAQLFDIVVVHLEACDAECMSWCCNVVQWLSHAKCSMFLQDFDITWSQGLTLVRQLG